MVYYRHPPMVSRSTGPPRGRYVWLYTYGVSTSVLLGGSERFLFLVYVPTHRLYASMSTSRKSRCWFIRPYSCSMDWLRFACFGSSVAFEGRTPNGRPSHDTRGGRSAREGQRATTPGSLRTHAASEENERGEDVYKPSVYECVRQPSFYGGTERSQRPLFCVYDSSCSSSGSCGEEANDKGQVERCPSCFRISGPISKENESYRRIDRQGDRSSSLNCFGFLLQRVPWFTTITVIFSLFCLFLFSVHTTVISWLQ